MKQTIFLRTKQQQQAAINAILATPLDKDKPVTIRITDYKRNLDQNAKFHAMVADIARQVQWRDKWLKPEQWKVLLISGHAVATKQEADVLPGLEGEYVNIRESSAQMSVKRMASLIEYMNLRHTANSVSSSTPGMTIQSDVLWLVTSLVSHLLVLLKSRFTLPGVTRTSNW